MSFKWLLCTRRFWQRRLGKKEQTWTEWWEKHKNKRTSQRKKGRKKEKSALRSALITVCDEFKTQNKLIKRWWALEIFFVLFYFCVSSLNIIFCMLLFCTLISITLQFGSQPESQCTHHIKYLYDMPSVNNVPIHFPFRIESIHLLILFGCYCFCLTFFYVLLVNFCDYVVLSWVIICFVWVWVCGVYSECKATKQHCSARIYFKYIHC